MEILLNGKPQQIDEPASVASLLDALGLAGKPVAVELNEQVVPRAQHHQQTLRAGDQLEVVSLVGGG